MRRLGLGLLLACWTAAAAADWTFVGGITDIYAAYADTASKRKVEADHVQMWGLYNFSRPDVAVTGDTHRSTRSLREYDCNTPRVRLISVVDHVGAMGTGPVIPLPDAREPGRWEAVIPDAVDESFWKAACGS